MFVKSTVAVAMLASFVVAQNVSNTIDPNSVTATLRSQWCLGQKNTCGTLCSGMTADNDCDSTTLEIKCNCASNNSAPGLQYYINTMPTFICERVYDNCISANEGVKSGQDVCKANEAANCGHIDPANFTAAAATTSSGSAPTGTNAPAATGSGATTSTSKAAAPTMMPAQFGTGAIALGVAAAFGYML